MFNFINILEEVADSDLTGQATTTGSGFTWDDFWSLVGKWCVDTGVKIIIAILIWIISWTVINGVKKKLLKKQTLRKNKQPKAIKIKKKKGKKEEVVEEIVAPKVYDETIARVAIQSVAIVLKVLVIIALVGYLGIETTSISAVVLSLGTAISLAVQGTLSNVAGGIIILITRPFKIGDYITSGDFGGTVEDIQFFYTHITTPDGKAIKIPNNTLANNVIVNYSEKEKRRVEVIMSVDYQSDVAKAKKVMMDVLVNAPMILKDPASFVDVKEYADSSINIVARGWCKNADYWNAYFYMMNELKKALDDNDIKIPFNQIDVHVDGLTENK